MISYICACRVNKCRKSVQGVSSSVSVLAEWRPGLIGSQTERGLGLHARTHFLYLSYEKERLKECKTGGETRCLRLLCPPSFSIRKDRTKQSCFICFVILGLYLPISQTIRQDFECNTLNTALKAKAEEGRGVIHLRLLRLSHLPFPVSSFHE